MLRLALALFGAFSSLVRSRADLVMENLALRQQLALLTMRPDRPRPRLSALDRLLWVALSRLWSRWAEALVIVKPATVVRWHRQGFRLFWKWKSRKRQGRPRTDREIRELVRRMAVANRTWGAPRIHGELAKLGIQISQRTVARWMPPRTNPPSPSWRAFLENHLKSMVAVDFFVVPTATFRVLFVFVVVALDRRRVVHFNVTEHPGAAWTAQQIVNAFPEDTAPRYLVRDRDGIYGEQFRRRVRNLGIAEVITAARSPWQNCFAERLIGTIRRELLDHVIVLGEAHLRRLLRAYLAYYHGSRTHLSLAKDAPDPREVEPPERGRVVELPMAGGLHHRYTRRAA